MNILFVEDDNMIASGLIYALQSDGYTVTHCAGKQSAIQALKDHEFGLALLDLSLPDGNGLLLSRKHRKSPKRFPRRCFPERA